MSSRSALWRVLRAALLLAAVLAALGHASGRFPLRFVTGLELSIADARLRWLMPRGADPRIAIVDIDEKSLATIGRWPWGRDRLAALADELFVRQRAAVVGFDMLFAEADTSSGLPALERAATHSPAVAAELAALRRDLDLDARFARALAGRPAVLGFYLTRDRGGRRTGVLPAPVFGTEALHGRPVDLTRWNGFAADIEPLAHAAPRAGYFNHLPDADGLVRRVPLVAQLGDTFHESLALAVFRAYTGDPAVVPLWPDATGLRADYRPLSGLGLRQDGRQMVIPVDGRGRVRVPYRGDIDAGVPAFEYVSASELLQGRIEPGHLAGKLVLVGTTAPGLFDQRASPVADVMSGVEVHAHLLSGLLDGRLPVQPDWSGSVEVLEILLVSALLVIALQRLRPLRGAQFALAVATLLLGVNVWSEASRGLVLPVASPLLLTLVLYVGITVWGYVVEGRRRRSLARLFGAYVPPELVKEMARDPARYDMRAENRVLTIMFCDMRDFTRVSELLSPQDLRDLVNRFFSTMTQAIGSHRGTLDKYIGDAIMAFWGAPVPDDAHAANAVHAALAMTRGMRALNGELAGRGLPQIGLGIGLNAGLVCVGDMGSSMRRSYTVMGDAVNLASRIEGLTRHYGIDILVGQSVRDAVASAALPAGASEALRWVEVDRVRVKGKEQSVTLFTPALVPREQLPAFDEEMRLWQLALTSYRLQHWDDAQGGLAALRARFGASDLAALYALFEQRITLHRSTPPPPDWDGAQTFSSK